MLKNKDHTWKYNLSLPIISCNLLLPINTSKSQNLVQEYTLCIYGTELQIKTI